MLLCSNGSNTGGNTAVLHRKEWELQWDKLRLFYERLVKGDGGDSVDEEDLEEAEEGRVVVVVEAVHRQWVGWEEAAHRRLWGVGIIMVDDDLISACCCINRLMKNGPFHFTLCVATLFTF
jgi:hypothetical protein